MEKLEKEIAFLKDKADDLETPNKPSHRIRPFIEKFLNYRGKDKVLRLAREKGDVYLDNKQISFYPDYSIEIQHRMNGFNKVKKKLREKNVVTITRLN